MNITKQMLPSILKSIYPDTVAEYKFCETRKFRFDFYIPSLNCAIEYEGILSAKARHTSITGFSKDCEKYNLACVLGFKVLRYTALNLNNVLNDLTELKKLLTTKI